MAMNLRILGLATLMLSGCAVTPAYKDIAATQPVALGDGVTVTPQIEWGQANMSGFQGTLWTVDGAGLDALLFFVAAPGQPLIATKDKADSHVYQASMLPEDIAELTAANLEKLGFQHVKTSHLRPAAFGAAKGFRFDLSFMGTTGLEMQGMALGAQRNGHLDLILFTAPDEYYFGHYAPTVDRIFNSVQLSG